MATFTRLLVDRLRSQPDSTALVLQTARQPDWTLSVSDLIRAAAGWQSVLAGHGVCPGEAVLLILQHGSDLVQAYFGCVLNGSIPAVMPFLTEKLLPERYRAELSALLGVTRPAAVITYADFEGEVLAAGGGGDAPAVIVAERVRAEAAPEPDWEQLPGLRRDPDDIALLQHSSGTTGLQKGVALSHRAVLRQLEVYSRALRLDPARDTIVSWLPLYHDMGLIASFLMPLLLGVPLVLMSPFDWVRAPYRLLQSISAYRGTLTWLPNFAYNFCAQKIRDRDLQGVDLSSLRGVINCSEPCRPESHAAFTARFAGFGLNPAALMTCYAMAENVFAVTQAGLDGPVSEDVIDRDALQVERVARPVPADDGRAVVRMLSNGRPLPNVALRVVDANGADLPERAVGEIVLRSDCMLSEYYRRPEVTRKAFLPGGWYLTGDLGYLAGGELFVSGRKKDLIIVGGKNIYPQDIETAASQVPGVHPGRVVAFGLFDEAAGTEEVALVAEVDPAGPAEREALADAIRQAVTRGTAVTLRRVHLVGAGWIIKTSSGKTARGANKERFLKELATEG
ncbi:acyl-CoA synthetase [Longilinea arvoryzae]|uniref:Acyl-CoA synthetase n=1 Tax=Longilinea arvoryzae TaxID=360412 RepID=A0A0K8MYH9_9CHLR|nr:AMP-binding protein [Longilinea arvoryzae]GAP16096.1 acyl-CoA synthetase [Longilinea arvoryzae]